MYAPVGISVYRRLDHLRKTVEALSNNRLATETDIYFFSDAAVPGDEDRIAKVREFCQAVRGFRTVTVVQRQTNDRVNNNRNGIRQLMKSYGRFIWLEEDIVTAPGFLAFMNEALDFYEKQRNVISISGYCPPIKIPNGESDVFALNRFSAWGFSTWKEKFDIDLLENQDYELSQQQIRALNANGKDVVNMVRKEATGMIDALDVKVMYFQAKQNMVTVYPAKSLVQNIGHDGSGMHCGDTDKFFHRELWRKTEGFKMIADIAPCTKIVGANRKFRNGSIWRGGLRRLRRTLHKFLRIR